MESDLWPTQRDLADAFADELARAGGRVLDSCGDDTCLYARGVLPAVREVARGDGLQGGVALRADGEEIRVHPYVFRQVCRNGAIFAQSLGTLCLRRDDYDFIVIPNVREAVRACCDDQVFEATARQMRAARDVEADMLVNLISTVSRMPGGAAVLADILWRYRDGGDRSRFGLMNAVTAAARGREPRLRWGLEELGGGIAARLDAPPSPRGGTTARRVRREALAEAPVA